MAAASSFGIEATDGVAAIGKGTHERLVIDMARFVERLNARSAPLSGRTARRFA